MKKILSFLLVAVLVLALSGPVLAAEYEGTVPPDSVLLLDPDTGEVLYSKNPDARVYPASTTKILTAMVVLEQTADLQETVTVDANALSGIYEGDDSTLEPMLQGGEQITVEQLLYGLMLVSGNDCAAALAVHTAGSIEAFAGLMNDKAAALGMTNSHFQNPHGVQNDNHYTTAGDMAKLAAAALDTPAFMEIVSTPSYRLPATNLSPERDLYTSNRFLREGEDLPGTACPWVTGMKTGYTPTAGGCLVTSAELNGKRLLCLVYGDGSPDQRDRWFLTKDLLSFGFEALEAFAPAAPEEASPAEAEAPAPAEKAPSAAGGILLRVLGILLLVLALAALALTALRVYNTIFRSRRRPTARRIRRAAVPTLIAAFVLLIPSIFCLRQAGKVKTAIADYNAARKAEAAAIAAAEAAEAAKPVFDPAAGESAQPSQWGVTWSVIDGGQTVSSYQRAQPITFGDGADYFALPGVPTFRGNNYRSGGSYGTVSIQNNTLTTRWTSATSSLAGSESGAWTGSGWTGQPLMVQWDPETRAVMNLYDSKKTKDGLVEVIYATLDGHVYFLDLEDGSYTRDPLNLGMAFKGAGALDPRGWPLFYVGAGDGTADGKKPRMFVVSLIDGSVLYENGYDESFSLRTDHNGWCAFDSSPLVDAETDTLIWPGECGILYTIHLNTNYDPAAGTISVAPDEPVRVQYDTTRSGNERYWYGFECSAVAVDRCLYLSENGGMFFCLDLDTMDLLWAQDTRDDSNSTPVYEPDGEDHGYIYTAPSLHWTADSDMSGHILIYKLDAVTGQVVWSRNYDCWTVDGVSGGVQSSPVLGRPGSSIDGLIIYGVSRTPGVNSGVLTALDTQNGCEVWSLSMDNYAWSSPLALYDSSGRAWLVLCDSAGTMFLLDGATGQVLSTASLGSLVEASPAAFNDTLVVGTRGQQIYAMTVG